MPTHDLTTASRESRPVRTKEQLFLVSSISKKQYTTRYVSKEAREKNENVAVMDLSGVDYIATFSQGNNTHHWRLAKKEGNKSKKRKDPHRPVNRPRPKRTNNKKKKKRERKNSHALGRYLRALTRTMYLSGTRHRKADGESKSKEGGGENHSTRGAHSHSSQKATCKDKDWDGMG